MNYNLIMKHVYGRRAYSIFSFDCENGITVTFKWRTLCSSEWLLNVNVMFPTMVSDKVGIKILRMQKVTGYCTYQPLSRVAGIFLLQIRLDNTWLDYRCMVSWYLPVLDNPRHCNPNHQQWQPVCWGGSPVVLVSDSVLSPNSPSSPPLSELWTLSARGLWMNRF